MITITKFMKTAVVAVALSFIGAVCLNAQDSDSSSVSVDAGLDVYSSYVFRGVKFGTGPAFQPWVELGAGNFAVGAWGSASAGDDEATEMDLYLSYSFDFGLSLGVTDYYYPVNPGYDDDGVFSTGEFFNYNFGDSVAAHALEINLGYEIGNLSLSANYIPLASAVTDGGDMYFEAAYAFGNTSVFLGAGNGWHTYDEFPSLYDQEDDSFDDVFGVVNVGVSTSKEVEITEKFSLPISGSVIVNPNQEQLYITVGVSF